jgi:uncharacterized membrane-anchored protein YitT (DUF2179 family)
MSLGRWLLLLDAMVLVGGMMVFANASLGLYSLISLFVTMQAVDWTVEGVDFAKEALVIPAHPGQIKEAIFSRLDRGVTFWKAEGRLYRRRAHRCSTASCGPGSSRFAKLVMEIDLRPSWWYTTPGKSWVRASTRGVRFL